MHYHCQCPSILSVLAAVLLGSPAKPLSPRSHTNHSCIAVSKDQERFRPPSGTTIFCSSHVVKYLIQRTLHGQERSGK
ncbi:hypothetical protein EI94DRAFT_1753537 [Lactarius quietus]|nr:hypothetical protein EI94DRAFT_1753537 [Lactarius quietus]